MVSRIVALEVEGLKISGQLYLPGGGDQAPYPTVCICHGIPHGSSVTNSDVSDRGYPLLAEMICREGFVVMIFNFRGTGESGGNFDILGWTRDLRAAIDYLWVLPEVNRSRLVLLGFSGGAAVSIYVAAHDKRVSSLVACACPAEFSSLLTEGGQPQSLVDHFRSIGTIRDEGFPHSAEEWLGNFELVSPVKYVAGIAPRPLLLMHGSQDEVVDVSHAYRLYSQAGEPKQIIIVDGGEHQLRRSNRAMAQVIDWLKNQTRSGA